MILAPWTVVGATVVGLLQTTPIVRGREVTFVADFNGWEGGAMTPSRDGRGYTL
jgi:hypothetical protein